MHIMRFLQRIKEAIVDFLFPKAERVLELESMSSEDLLRLLPPSDDIDQDTFALFDYSFPLTRELVWEIKYSGNELVAEKFALVMYDFLVGELEERSLFEKFDRPLLMPIPISDKRRDSRGWNQTEILAEALSEIDKDNLFKYKPRQLVKHWHTESQTRTSTRTERLKNIKDSMKLLAPHVVKGRCVILIDDVTTTGATFAEAKRVLKEAGAKKVLCVAIAH